jgi:hypothetical protein
MPVDFLSLFITLNSTGIRYVVTGGLAAVLHGVDRLTADVDLAIDLSADAPAALVRLLTDAGFKPVAPVNPMDFAQEKIRNLWMRERGMKVFSFWDQQGRRPTIDVMLDNPIPFDELHGHSTQVYFRGTPIRVASIPDLIRMKQYAGRPQDLADIARLEEILSARPQT